MIDRKPDLVCRLKLVAIGAVVSTMIAERQATKSAFADLTVGVVEVMTSCAPPVGAVAMPVTWATHPSGPVITVPESMRLTS